MTVSKGKPKYSDPALRAAVLYAIHMQDLDPNVPLITSLPKGPLSEDYERVLAELTMANLIFNKSGMHLTPLGQQVLFGKVLSPLSLDFPKRPAKNRLGKVLRWFVFRKSQNLKSNPLDWLATAIMYAAVYFMAVAALDSAASPSETIERTIKLLAVALNAVGATYIAAGVIYVKPNHQFENFVDLQEHFAQALADASRHCIFGIFFILLSIAIDQTQFREFSNHFFGLPVIGNK